MDRLVRLSFIFVMALFTLIFSAIGVRLIMLGNESPPEKSLPAAPPSSPSPTSAAPIASMAAASIRPSSIRR